MARPDEVQQLLEVDVGRGRDGPGHGHQSARQDLYAAPVSDDDPADELRRWARMAECMRQDHRAVALARAALWPEA
ncbi:hypothetical protein GCM10011509_30120 [Ornithinimicrobium pekingense]|uniref:Uncharacterized protein n=1 Tax=Ornithinimicrobium pekingense TaxID=384677 RepID=A0ABQ2FDT5_9MICO|nr:hypothetical protein GCM10011509_30120 [Ornithinimicrobium pekingense]